MRKHEDNPSEMAVAHECAAFYCQCSGEVSFTRTNHIHAVKARFFLLAPACSIPHLGNGKLTATDYYLSGLLYEPF